MPVTSPRYARIADTIRRRIKSGEYQPGDQLPTEREIREEFEGVSLSVVRAAVAELRSEGLVESQQGKGTFVREHKELVRWASNRYERNKGVPNRLEMDSAGVRDEVTAEIRFVEATPEVAARLDIEPGDMVSEVLYRWYADGEPVQISTQWEPLAITGGTSIERPAGPQRGQPDVITRFDSIGYHVDRVDENIRSRMPAPDEAEALRLPSGVPVLYIERTHQAQVPVETANIIMRADRFVIQVRQEVDAP